MATSDITMKPLGMRIKVMHVVRFVLASIVRIFCTLYYGKTGKKFPPITADILKLPAVEVANKIRSKEVGIVIFVTNSGAFT